VFDQLRTDPSVWHFAFQGARDIAEMPVAGREYEYLWRRALDLSYIAPLIRMFRTSAKRLPATENSQKKYRS
jgi:hypothetical protein